MGIIKRDRWTESEVLSFPLGEHALLERKSGALLTDYERAMAKALSALANSGGGYLIFGQKDDGSFDGLPEKKGETPIREWLEQKLPYLVSYPLQDFRVHNVEPDAATSIPANMTVIIIEIGDSNLAPHQSAKDNLYYYRVGGHSKPAPHFYLETLRGRSRFPNPEVVRAWLDTVINPLLSDLAEQHTHLHQRSWRFERQTQSITGVHPLLTSPLSKYQVKGNQEQFFEIYPDIEEAFNRRERAYPLFQRRIMEFFKVIRESQALLECYKICTSTESLQTVRMRMRDTSAQALSDADLLSRFYSGTEDSFLDRLTGHIVNRTGEMIDTYIDSPFWNTQRGEFLSLLRSTEAGYCEMHIKAAAEALLNEGLSFTHLLEDTKKQLSQQHGVPYYQPAASIAATLF